MPWSFEFLNLPRCIVCFGKEVGGVVGVGKGEEEEIEVCEVHGVL